MRHFYLPASMLLVIFSHLACSVDSQSKVWKTQLNQNLDLLGHRNWILVVDKAFPEQSAPGMNYLYADEDILKVLDHVLNEIEAAGHVEAVIFRDRELDYIGNDQVEGIAEFKNESQNLLADREIQSLLHDEVFAMLDESASLFKVLVIKTNTLLPYTSFFLQLDCAYWNAEQEETLRKEMDQLVP
jgi:D-ribose pyranose/furanose isomerase RbsD